MKIKTRLIKEGSQKTIRPTCPNCKESIERKVDKNQLADEAQCYICDSVFFWSIEK